MDVTIIGNKRRELYADMSFKMSSINEEDLFEKEKNNELRSDFNLHKFITIYNLYSFCSCLS